MPPDMISALLGAAATGDDEHKKGKTIEEEQRKEEEQQKHEEAARQLQEQQKQLDAAKQLEEKERAEQLEKQQQQDRAKQLEEQQQQELAKQIQEQEQQERAKQLQEKQQQEERAKQLEQELQQQERAKQFEEQQLKDKKQEQHRQQVLEEQQRLSDLQQREHKLLEEKKQLEEQKKQFEMMKEQQRREEQRQAFQSMGLQARDAEMEEELQQQELAAFVARQEKERRGKAEAFLHMEESSGAVQDAMAAAVAADILQVPQLSAAAAGGESAAEAMKHNAMFQQLLRICQEQKDALESLNAAKKKAGASSSSGVGGSGSGLGIGSKVDSSAAGSFRLSATGQEPGDFQLAVPPVRPASASASAMTAQQEKNAWARLTRLFNSQTLTRSAKAIKAPESMVRKYGQGGIHRRQLFQTWLANDEDCEKVEEQLVMEKAVWIKRNNFNFSIKCNTDNIRITQANPVEALLITLCCSCILC